MNHVESPNSDAQLRHPFSTAFHIQAAHALRTLAQKWSWVSSAAATIGEDSGAMAFQCLQGILLQF